MDMVMVGDFNGLDTLQAILTLYPKQKVIIASGYTEDECATAAKKLGASWLTKPYERADLAKAVRLKLDS